MKLQPLVVFAATAMLVACGGGGGGGSNAPAPTNSAGTQSTPTPATLSGTVVDYVTGTPVLGMTVTLGTAPNSRSCNAAQTNAANVCGTVSSVGATSTTASDGTFTLAAVPAGTYMLMIGPSNGSYATLHRSFTVAAGANALGTVKLTALSASLQSWLADVNSQRATVSTPVSFANLVVDEYAQEQATLWANSVAAGTTAYGDTAFGAYQTGYNSSTGAMYVAAGVESVEPNPTVFSTTVNGVTIPAGSPGWLLSDNSWMSEKTLDDVVGSATYGCQPYSGNWQACEAANPPSSAGWAYIGHYYNISDTQDVWVGLGIASTSNAGLGGTPIGIVIVQNTGSVGPLSVSRVKS